MISDQKLSEHFSLYELTVTSNAALIERNREEALKYIPTLKALANLLEIIRGDRPLVVNSAFRCGALNSATVGSSLTSQHPRGQAADIHRPGQSIEDLFNELRADAKAGKFKFGQMIHEQANRGYAVAEWVHISLGLDFWIPERCGEVLVMKAGPDGKPHYTSLEKVPQEA